MKKPVTLLLLVLMAGQLAFADDDSAAKKFGNGVKKGGESVGQSVKQGADTLGKGVKKGAESVGKTFNDWFGGKPRKDGEKHKDGDK